MVLKGWRVLCRCPLALPMSPVSLPGDVHTCRPFRRPNTSLLSSGLVLAPCSLHARPLPKRLDGAACARALQAAAGACVPGGWLGEGRREGGSGAGPQLGFAQLGFAQEGGRVKRRCVRGADWAAVVSPSLRDEASAKQVLPWRDRHGPLKATLTQEIALGSPVCEWVVPWLCCAAPPAARDRCQCTIQTSHTLCINATYQSFTQDVHP
jgi:hypothetical protein